MTWGQYARFRSQLIGRIAYDNGALVPVSLPLRNAGYLEKLRLIHSLSGTFAGAPTGVDPLGQYGGALQRVTVRVNGVGDLFDCSGSMAAVISAIHNQYEYGYGQLLPAPPGAFASAPGTAAYVNLWPIDIPIAFDLANKSAPWGLVQLATNSMDARIECRFNPQFGTQQSGLAGVPAPGTAVYGGAGAVQPGTASGYVDVTQDFYDPIADPASQPPLGFIHRWREIQQFVTADGDVDFKLPASNLYMRLVLWYVQGAANALTTNGFSTPAAPGVITRVQLRYGGNLAPLDWNAATIMARMQRQYGFAMPTGVYVLDLVEDTHTERDFIDSSATTDLRVTVTFASGSYAGGAYVKMGIEELVPIASPVAGQVTPQGPAPRGRERVNCTRRRGDARPSPLPRHSAPSRERGEHPGGHTPWS